MKDIQVFQSFTFKSNIIEIFRFASFAFIIILVTPTRHIFEMFPWKSVFDVVSRAQNSTILRRGFFFPNNEWKKRKINKTNERKTNKKKKLYENTCINIMNIFFLCGKCQKRAGKLYRWLFRAFDVLAGKKISYFFRFGIWEVTLHYFAVYIQSVWLILCRCAITENCSLNRKGKKCSWESFPGITWLDWGKW